MDLRGMRAGTTRGRLRVARLLGAAGLFCRQACAGHHAPPPARPAAAPVRLAWLPLEPLVAPEVAAAVNDRLERLAVPGGTRSFRASLSMEVAQLALECIEPTAACYTAVGKSVGADRLLWGELRPGPPPDKSIRVQLVLFDVHGGAVLQRADRTFPGVEE